MVANGLELPIDALSPMAIAQYIIVVDAEHDPACSAVSNTHLPLPHVMVMGGVLPSVALKTRDCNAVPQQGRVDATVVFAVCSTTFCRSGNFTMSFAALHYTVAMAIPQCYC